MNGCFKLIGSRFSLQKLSPFLFFRFTQFLFFIGSPLTLVADEFIVFVFGIVFFFTLRFAHEFYFLIRCFLPIMKYEIAPKIGMIIVIRNQINLSIFSNLFLNMSINAIIGRTISMMLIINQNTSPKLG